MSTKTKWIDVKIPPLYSQSTSASSQNTIVVNGKEYRILSLVARGGSCVVRILHRFPVEN